MGRVGRSAGLGDGNGHSLIAQGLDGALVGDRGLSALREAWERRRCPTPTDGSGC